MKIKILLLFILLWVFSSVAMACNCEPNQPQNTKLYIVSFADGADSSIIETYGQIDYQFKTINAIIAFLTPEAAELLRQEPGITAVEEDQKIQISPAASTSQELPRDLGGGVQTMDLGPQWNLGEEGINAEAAWDNFNVDGTGVKIAIIDSGVNYNLSSLNEGYLGGHDFCPDFNESYPYCHNEDDNVMDEYGHGTEMASAILSDGDTTKGVAPNSNYYAVKITSDTGESWVTILSKGVDWAIDKNVDVIYIGIPTYFSYDVLYNLTLKAFSRGIPIVAGTYDGSYVVPAVYEKVIGIGAHTQDPQVMPDTGDNAEVVAPGEEVPVLDLEGNDIYAVDSVGVAAAQVAGALALMIDYNRTNEKGYSSSDLWKTLNYSAVDLWPSDPLAGWGKADVNNALTLMANDWFLDCNAVYTEPNYIDSNTPGYFINGSLNYEVTISNNIPIDFTGHKDINDMIITASLRYDGNDLNLPFSTQIFDINLPRGQTEYLSASYNIESSAEEGTIALDINIVVGGDGPEVVIKKMNGAAYAIVKSPCGWEADFITDKIVDFKDFAKLASWWLLPCDIGNSYCYGTDLFTDGVIDFQDLQVFLSYWLCRYP